jgi:hypothetical protein
MREEQKKSELVTIEMRRATLLVIFEYLARSHEEWKGSEENCLTTLSHVPIPILANG